MLLTKQIEVYITPRNINHYKEKGYAIPMKYSEKSGKEIIDSNIPILVMIEDLSRGSHARIECQCDNCHEIQTFRYADWCRRKYPEFGDLCKKCATKIKLPHIMEQEYGASNSANIPSFIAKKKETNLKKYGNEWSIASESVRESIVNEFIEKYGVDNPMKNEAVQQKAKRTNRQRYGGNCSMCDEAVRQKSVETCMKKYGVPNAYQSKEIQAKARKTLCENGNIPTSKAEKEMCRLLCKIFGKDKCLANYPVGVFTLDCLLQIGEERIDVEYDGFYWHKNRKQKDGARNAILMNEGYRILRIKANNQDSMPSQKQIKEAVDYLVKDNHHLTFIDMNN